MRGIKELRQRVLAAEERFGLNDVQRAAYSERLVDLMNGIEGRIRAPLLVVHGARDKTVPTRYGRRLFAAAPEPKELFILEGGTHNDLYDHPQVAERVIAFLRRHAPGLPKALEIRD